jgi:hypothetical protein
MEINKDSVEATFIVGEASSTWNSVFSGRG